VTDEDVILLEAAGGEIVALGTLGPGGKVLDFALDPRLLGDARQSVARELVRYLEVRCRERGDEEIRFDIPHVDQPVRRAMEAAGYRSEDTRSLIIEIVDLAVLVESILHHREERLPHGWHVAFRIELEPGSYRSCPQRLLLAELGGTPSVRVEVLEGDSASECDCAVRIDLSTLTDIIFRIQNFDDALDGGSLTVEPDSMVQDARTFFSFLSLRSPWHTPSSDGR
jgi:hypothetical protein